VRDKHQHPSVLVVDDEPGIRELLKLQLVNAGYEVRLAEDAIVAGRALMESPPDLMIVDVALPYLGGLEFVATLNADTTVPHVPVIFITGREQAVSRARALGAECLMKPVESQRLLELVERHVQVRADPRKRAAFDYLSLGT
jgi:DNA-binding response OmpR family regulator